MTLMEFLNAAAKIYPTHLHKLDNALKGYYQNTTVYIINSAARDDYGFPIHRYEITDDAAKEIEIALGIFRKYWGFGGLPYLTLGKAFRVRPNLDGGTMDVCDWFKELGLTVKTLQSNWRVWEIIEPHMRKVKKTKVIEDYSL